DKREGRGEEGRRRTGRRTILQSYVNECCNLLDSLGVPYIRSKGEAEALCSILNYTGMADGVLTNDSDSFLYGATTVYRDLHTTERSPTVECYTMKDIHEKLALNRSDLIALALLLGCDYCPQGVVGVGKETALQFLRASKSGSQSTSDVLDQFQEWRNGSITEDDIESKIQLTVFRKAMSSPNFPQKEVIREFLRPPDLSSSSSPSSLAGDDTRLRHWRQPLLHSTQVMCHHHLQWPLEYTAKKMVPLMSQWAIRNSIRGGRRGKRR
ncbi:Flap endonuclease GEN homolog 1, partial [Geodia barretti]